MALKKTPASVGRAKDAIKSSSDNVCLKVLHFIAFLSRWKLCHVLSSVVFLDLWVKIERKFEREKGLRTEIGRTVLPKYTLSSNEYYLSFFRYSLSRYGEKSENCVSPFRK